MFCDATVVVARNALCQSNREKGIDQRVAYANKQLTTIERNYFITKRKCDNFLSKDVPSLPIMQPSSFFVDYMEIKFVINKPDLARRLLSGCCC